MFLHSGIAGATVKMISVVLWPMSTEGSVENDSTDQVFPTPSLPMVPESLQPEEKLKHARVTAPLVFFLLGP